MSLYLKARYPDTNSGVLLPLYLLLRKERISLMELISTVLLALSLELLVFCHSRRLEERLWCQIFVLGVCSVWYLFLMEGGLYLL